MKILQIYWGRIMADHKKKALSERGTPHSRWPTAHSQAGAAAQTHSQPKIGLSYIMYREARANCALGRAAKQCTL